MTVSEELVTLAAVPPEGVDPPWRVSFELFDGPLDLLLHLVKEKQLDIATVPLALVAEQYFEYISLMDSIDVEVAAEYLVIAATLVFLKSKSLLPAIPSEFLDDETETPEMVEERLRARLIAYSKYREVGEELRTRQLDASAFYYRDAGDPNSDLTQRYRIDPNKLTNAFLAMLRNAKPERRTIARERVSLLAQMDYIMKVVREKGEVFFSALCHKLGRESIIVTFLAILELIRRHRVEYEQPELFDDIRLIPVTASGGSQWS
ncbi:MAG: segregation/condensation protein A [Candidatus Eremiobacteraeota bacterium]|nr:segregation/condensation protein A [Candidatus Eremiobacteraeota bacterium]